MKRKLFFIIGTILSITALLSACNIPAPEEIPTIASTITSISPTQTPGPTSDPTIHYSNDFSNTNDQVWQLGGDDVTDNSGAVVPQFRITDGQYLITNTEDSSGITYGVESIAEGMDFSSGVLSIDYQVIKDVSSPGSVAEILFWVQSDYSQEIALVISDEYGGSIILYDPRTAQSAEDQFYEGSATLKDGINHVDLAFKDNSVSIYINGIFISTVEVIGKSSGTIGLGSFPSMGGSSTIAFDNLVVHTYDSWIPPSE